MCLKVILLHSMALALLARDWAQEAGTAMRALIVDHQVRDESADEAQRVRQRLEDLRE